MANDTTSRTSGIDSTDTAWSLSVHSNGVVILTLSEADRAMTLVLSGKELETFKSAVCGKEV